MALPKYVHLPYLKHVSLVTKICGLLQLVVICTLFFLQNCAISIHKITPINKFYSFIIFSLLINAVMLLLDYLVLVFYLFAYIFFLLDFIFST